MSSAVRVRSVVNNVEIEPHAKPENVKKKIEAALRPRRNRSQGHTRDVRDDDEVLLEGKVRNWDKKFASKMRRVSLRREKRQGQADGRILTMALTSALFMRRSAFV